MKEKQYRIVVNGKHEVSVSTLVEPHEYYIQAEEPQTAQRIARNLFAEKYPDAVEVTIVDGGKERRKNIVAAICMAIPVLISLIPWTYDVTKAFIIKPTMLSTLMAAALYSSVIIRLKGLANSFKNASDTILTLLTLLVCSSFRSFFCGDTTKDFPLPFPDIPIPGKTFLLIAIAASWLGISAVSGFMWIFLFILSAARMTAGDAAMGNWGMVYILSAFVGIILQLKQQSAGFRTSLQQDLVTATARMKRQVIHDAGAAAQSVKTAARKIKGN
jgi:hypothetical protein